MFWYPEKTAQVWREDGWFHTNVTMMPELEFVLRRGGDGRVDGAALLIEGGAEIPLVKASGTPRFEPLPQTRAADAPPATQSGRTVLWIIAGLLAAAALALLLALD